MGISGESRVICLRKPGFDLSLAWEHLTFATKLEIGVLRQEAEGKRKKEGGRRRIFTNIRCSLLLECDRPFEKKITKLLS